MAISQSICNSFKTELLGMATHQSSDTFKIALIKVGATGTYGAGTLNAGTPGTGTPTVSNLGTDEVAASATYSAGGSAIVTLASSLDTNTAIWSADTESAA